MKSAPLEAEPLSPEGTDAWLQAASALLHSSAWGPYLRYREIDLLDVLRAPLYLKLRATVRHEAGTGAGVLTRGIAAARLAGYRLQEARRVRKLLARSVPVEPADVLFWPREPTHLKAHLPVLRQVRQQGTRAAVLACHPAAFEGLLAAGETPSFTHAAWPTELRAGQQAARSALRRLTQLDPPSAEQFPAAPQRALLVAQLRGAILQNLEFAYQAVTNAHAALEHFQPRALVVGNDMTAEGRGAVLVAATRQVLSYCPMHGTLVGNPLYRHHVADRLLLYGESARRQLLTLGVEESRMRICGAPYLDNTPQQSGEIEPRIAEQLGLDPRRPYVLVATSGPGNMISHRHHAAMIQAVMQATLAHPEVQFVAKLHRKDRPEYYENAGKTIAGQRLIVVPNATPGLPGDIFSWLQGARAMITGASAVATEAMLLQVPVITMDLAGELVGVDFIQGGATQHVTEAAGVAEAVAQVLSGGPAAEQVSAAAGDYVRDLFFLLDGRSAERAATLIRTEALSATTLTNG